MYVLLFGVNNNHAFYDAHSKINFCSHESITGPRKVKHNSSERGRARRRGYGSQAAGVRRSDAGRSSQAKGDVDDPVSGRKRRAMAHKLRRNRQEGQKKRDYGG